MQTILSTAGDGYWSTAAKPVHVTDIKLQWYTDEKDFGELCVYFNTKYWDVDTDGLIYTDSNFLAELNAFLIKQGLCAAQYSEQGMQGDDYVSLDVEGDFIAAWEAKFGVVA